MTTDDLTKEHQGLMHSIEMLQMKDAPLSREERQTLSRWHNRIAEIDATLYPAPTREEVKRAEIPDEYKLENSLRMIRKTFGPPSGSWWVE